MKIDISGFKMRYSKGPGGIHPLMVSDPGATWLFEIESKGRVQEFRVLGSLSYGETAKKVKEFLARTLSLQTNPKVRLVR